MPVAERLKVFRALPPDGQAVVWMLMTSVTFTGMLVLVKFLGATYSAPVQTFFRQLAGAIVLIPFIWRFGLTASFATAAPVALFVRSALAVAGLILAFYSFQKLPLAQANTLAFTRPFWVTLLAAVFLGERPSLVRIAAMFVGFGGVLLIARPDADGVELLPALAGLASTMMFAAVMILLKRLTGAHDTLSLLSWSAALGLVFSVGPAALDWTTPTGSDWLLLFGMGGLAVFNQFCFVRAVRIGSPTAIATLDNVRLPMAVLAGYLFFAEVPDPLAYVGMAVVAGAALIASLPQRAAQPPSTGIT